MALRRPEAATSPRSRRGRPGLTALALLPIAALAVAVAGSAGDVARAVASVSPFAFAVASGLTMVSLLARSEQWGVSLAAAGATTPRRLVHAASAANYAVGSACAQLGHVARVAALRRIAPDDVPPLSTMVVAEARGAVAGLAVSVLLLAAVAHPLGLEPGFVALAVGATALVFAVLALVHHRAPEHRLARGIAALVEPRYGWRLALATAVAYAAQIARAYVVLDALGVDVTVQAAVVVYLAGGIANTLPMGGTVGTAAAMSVVSGSHLAVGAGAGLVFTAASVAASVVYVAWAFAVCAVGRRRRAARVAAPLVPAVAVARSGEPG
jgi:hypothetical protein